MCSREQVTCYSKCCHAKSKEENGSSPFRFRYFKCNRKYDHYENLYPPSKHGRQQTLAIQTKSNKHRQKKTFEAHFKFSYALGLQYTLGKEKSKYIIIVYRVAQKK